MNGRKTFAIRMLVGTCVVCFFTWALADYWPLNVETPFNGYRKVRGFSIGEELAFVPQVIAVLVIGIGGAIAATLVPVAFFSQFIRGREKFYHNGHYNDAVALLAPLVLMWTGSFLIEIYLNGVNLMRVPLLLLVGASFLVTLVGIISNLVDPEAKWFSKRTSSVDSAS